MDKIKHRAIIAMTVLAVFAVAKEYGKAQQQQKAEFGSDQSEVLADPAKGELPECLFHHTVKQTDVPSEVAARYEITPEALLRANPQLASFGDAGPGDKLCLPGGVNPLKLNSKKKGSTQAVAQTAGTPGERPVPATRNGDFQPPPEVVAIVQRHFGDLGPKVVEEALMITRCESSYNASVHRGYRNHTGDFGLFQVNYIHDRPGGLLPRMGFTRYDMLIGNNNAKVARRLYDNRAAKGQHKWQDWKQSRKCHGI